MYLCIVPTYHVYIIIHSDTVYRAARQGLYTMYGVNLCGMAIASADFVSYFGSPQGRNFKYYYTRRR